MFSAPKLILAAVAGTLLIGSAASAQVDHPRREQVNDRLQNQNRRINHEYREGEISRQRAAQLHAQDRAIHAREAQLVRRNGGYLTRAQQEHLNARENNVSGRIGG